MHISLNHTACRDHPHSSAYKPPLTRINEVERTFGLRVGCVQVLFQGSTERLISHHVFDSFTHLDLLHTADPMHTHKAQLTSVLRSKVIFVSVGACVYVRSNSLSPKPLSINPTTACDVEFCATGFTDRHIAGNGVQTHILCVCTDSPQCVHTLL